jgi:hypothetical protein
MIILKDILTPLEWKTTMLVLKQTRDKFGQKDYIMFKKMVMVVGYIYGLDGYIGYHVFINRALELIKSYGRSPTHTFGFESRLYTDSFFGVEKGYIVDASLDDIRVKMSNTRLEMLKVKSIHH